jgi:hypothetical protein
LFPQLGRVLGRFDGRGPFPRASRRTTRYFHPIDLLRAVTHAKSEAAQARAAGCDGLLLGEWDFSDWSIGSGAEECRSRTEVAERRSANVEDIVRHFAALRHLRLEELDWDGGLPAERIKALRSFAMRDVRDAGDGAFLCLLSPSLAGLEMRSVRWSSAPRFAWGGGACIRDLRLEDVALGSQVGVIMRRCRGLRSIDIRDVPSLCPSDLATAIAHSPRLRGVRLGGVPVRDELADAVSRLQETRYMYLLDCELSLPEGSRAGHGALHRLRLWNVRPPRSVSVLIRRGPLLQDVGLLHMDVDGDTLAALLDRPRLRLVSLVSCRILDPSALVRFVARARPMHISIRDCGMTHEWRKRVVSSCGRGIALSLV